MSEAKRDDIGIADVKAIAHVHKETDPKPDVYAMRPVVEWDEIKSQ